MKKYKMIMTKVLGIYDDAEDAAKAAAAAEAAAEAAAAAGKFTEEQQVHVNKLIKAERLKGEEAKKSVLEELELIKKKGNLTEKERKTLDTKIKSLQTDLLTKEQLAARDKEKIIDDYETEKKELTNDRDIWKSRFTTTTIDSAIITASVEHEAFNPEPIVALLKPNTQLVEDVDEEGKPNGILIPKVTFSDVDKEGKPLTLQLTPKEAVKRMKEKDSYANLFKDPGTGGVGGRNVSSPKGNVDIVEIAKDPKKYREYREKVKL